MIIDSTLTIFNSWDFASVECVASSSFFSGQNFMKMNIAEMAAYLENYPSLLVSDAQGVGFFFNLNFRICAMNSYWQNQILYFCYFETSINKSSQNCVVFLSFIVFQVFLDQIRNPLTYYLHSPLENSIVASCIVKTQLRNCIQVQVYYFLSQKETSLLGIYYE